MQDFAGAFGLAFRLIASGDADLFEIVGLSMRVSLTALLLSCLVGFPIGALLVVRKFFGRGIVIALVNSMMGFPPVVIGLLVYLALSRAGPMGSFGLLYSPTAMIIAQTLLIAPIVAALSRQVLEALQAEYDEQFRSLGISRGRAVLALIVDGRYGLVTVALAGFGRAVAEVGAVMIVGGNIDHLTRVMTTAIALETSKGDLGMALALGIILMSIAISVNLGAGALRAMAERQAYA
ncbi:ABC-type tungstate transport system, periplasmic component [Hoeflea sp. IMCC20628]|uniref:ABC transporter permease n=1 Tax=Hoeflea sp. IMCC20628 TaxID=1620421 RepID=UPI00063AB538|nr:ABC transporter permease [Hoeflea sp. IMCC20628]AKI01988.1 ABC-type tungstate transport system, periplasmic component [Hoeflea sp. IMCC20628]